MLNQVVLVGRLVRDVQLNAFNDKKKTYITLAIPRSYRNVNGCYDSDFISCVLWQGIAENTATYCKKGDIIGIRGRIESNSYEKGSKTVYTSDIVVERVFFLPSKKEVIKKEE